MCLRALLTAGLLLPPLLPGSPSPRDAAGSWPRWRGPQDNGSAETGTYPVRWDLASGAGVRWKTALPGKGCSTPIVWNERIMLTAPVEGQDSVLAFDWAGQPLWQTRLGPERAGKHRNGSGSNPSAVTDGTRVFAYFKSGTLAALDLAGKVQWQTNLAGTFGRDTLYWDFGTSPVVGEQQVMVALLRQGESWLLAFRKDTGALAWKVPRNYTTPVEADHSYATPLLFRHQQREALLVWGAERLTAHATSDGSLLWSCGAFNPEVKANWVAVASPVLAGDLAVVPYGRGTRLHAIRLGGHGDVTQSHRAWVREDTGTFVPSPVVYAGKLYLVRDRGEVECIEPATGRTVWAAQLPKSSSSYYASPAAADGKLYAAREDGVIFVARVAGGFELLSENPLDERLIASPVPVADRLLVRGERHLFCLGP